MEKLVLCSKVLYDHDMADKAKQVRSLEKTLQFHRPFKRKFSCEHEWLLELCTIKTRINTFIFNLINEEADEYNQMEVMGITPTQSSLINHMLKIELTNLSRSPIWSEQIANLICYNAKSLIQSYVKTGIWTLMFHTSDSSEIANIIYNAVNDQFSCYNSSIGIGSIHTIPYYCCVKCGTNTDICFDDVESNPYCPDCAEEEGIDLEYDDEDDESVG